MGTTSAHYRNFLGHPYFRNIFDPGAGLTMITPLHHTANALKGTDIWINGLGLSGEV